MAIVVNVSMEYSVSRGGELGYAAMAAADYN